MPTEAVYNVEPPIQSNTERKPRSRGPRAYFSRAERRQRVFYDAFVVCLSSYLEITNSLDACPSIDYEQRALGGSPRQFAPISPLCYRLIDYTVDFSHACRDAISKVEYDSFLRAIFRNGRVNLNTVSAPAMAAYGQCGQVCMARGLFLPAKYLSGGPDNRANLVHAGHVSRRRPSKLRDPEWRDVGSGARSG
jgi:hypothetical protein